MDQVMNIKQRWINLFSWLCNVPHKLASKISWFDLDLSPAIVMFHVTATSKMVLKSIQPSAGACMFVTTMPGAGGWYSGLHLVPLPVICGHTLLYLRTEINLICPLPGCFCRQNYNGGKVKEEVEWTEDVITASLPALLAWTIWWSAHSSQTGILQSWELYCRTGSWEGIAVLSCSNG